jgi:hypothetical protein
MGSSPFQWKDPLEFSRVDINYIDLRIMNKMMIIFIINFDNIESNNMMRIMRVNDIDITSIIFINILYPNYFLLGSSENKIGIIIIHNKVRNNYNNIIDIDSNFMDQINKTIIINLGILHLLKIIDSPFDINING